MAKVEDDIDLEACKCTTECKICDEENNKDDLSDEFALCETTPTHVRHAFIRKVFTIVLCQLVFAFGVMLICYNIKAAKTFFLKYSMISYAASILYVISVLLISCFPSLTRNSSVATLCLFYFTPLATIMLTGYCCIFNAKEIAIATGISLFLVTCLILFSIQTKYDFTNWIWTLAFVTLQFVMHVAICSFIKSRVKNIIFSTIGTVIFAIWIIVDVQMIVGGHHTLQFTVDEYLFASLSLFTDIITLFMDLLKLVRF